MMKKIVQTINTIISNEAHIDRVIKTSFDEYFFQYQHKHKFSIKRDWQNIIFRIYYDSQYDIETLANSNGTVALNKFLEFTTKEFNLTEEKESFKDLMDVIEKKVILIDNILDNIIFNR